MGMFAKRIQRQQFIRNGTAPVEETNQRQEAKSLRARANRKRLNAAKKRNPGNQFRGGQNRKKGRKTPKWQIEVGNITIEQIAATEYGKLMMGFAETVGAL